MSEQKKFNQWWESKGTNSVILRAQAWSAWMARAEVDQPQQAEDPDEWATQDRVHMRPNIDETRWVRDVPGDRWVGPWKMFEGLGVSYMHGSRKAGDKHYRIEVRCRRRDLPKVEPKQCSAGCHGPRCPNPASPGKDHCGECANDDGTDWSYHEKQKPQPQKRILRLWIDSDCNVHAGLKGDRDLELHYDHETRQFYTEEAS